MKFQIIAGDPSLDFVNTLDNRPVPARLTELLPNYQALAEWASQAGAINSRQFLRLIRASERHPKEAAAVLTRAIQLRECLFRIFTSLVARRKPDANDLDALNAFVSRAAPHLQLKAEGKAFQLDWKEEENPSLDSVLWPVIRSAANFLVSGDLKRLRECNVKACRWLFVDRSKNHSRRWCDMKTCGNRTKVRKFYRRQQSGQK